MKKKQKIILGATSALTVVILILSLFFVIRAYTKKEPIIPEKKITEKTKEPMDDKQQLVTQAKNLAQSYDYDQAITLLEKNSKNGSPETQQLLQTLKKEKEQLIDWSDPTQISHVFFHSLIVDPQKAFHSQQAQGYKDYMVTVEEFNRSIEQLYQNDFVLVNLNDLIQKDEQGNLSFNGLALPEGKKPLILSQDDVSYYEYMDNSGFPSRLVVSNNNEIKNVYKENDKEEIGDFDMVPLIDAFVKKHPDFSYRGAKGTLALTGYNGVLGYRTSKSQYGDNEKTKKESEEAKKVADQLKKDGWSFASHTWGHLNMTQASLEDVKKDNELWQQEVAPILGKTNILIYPFGADISDWQPYSAENQKFAYLKSQGFDIFCNVDASTPAWGQLGTDFYRNARINIDGIRFQSDLDGQNPILDPFINVHEVYDKEARESA